MNPVKSATKKAAKKAASSSVFSKEELAAARETARERKLALSKEEAESAVLAAITAMKEPDRSMARRIHAIIKASAPDLSPKTWYGMPAYADKDGKVVCFFQSAQKFNYRYATLGFQEAAHLDEGSMWPTAYALTKLTSADEERITALVKKAVS